MATKPKPKPFPLLGHWNIIHSDDFEPDFLNLVEQAHISFKSKQRGGNIVFGAMEADLKWTPKRRSDGTTVFEFQGWEEGDEVSGSGTVKVRKDGKLDVKVSYDGGDDYSFVAEKTK